MTISAASEVREDWITLKGTERELERERRG